MPLIDVRTPFSIDELKFSDMHSITGDSRDQMIQIRTVGVGTDRDLCNKSEIDDLIQALQRAKLVW